MGAVTLIFLGLYGILSAKLVHGSTCAGTGNTWMVTQGQSPCDLHQALIRLCLPTWTADVLSYGQHYASGGSICGCNTVAASLAAACSNCQTAGNYNGPLYSWYLTSGNDATHRCVSITNGSIGSEITLPMSLKTQIPSWAWIDINYSQGYWPYRESYLTSRDTNLTSEAPPSNAPVPQQTTSSTLEQATMSVLGSSTSSISEQATLSTSNQTAASSTSEQATSSTSEQATSSASSTSEQATLSTSNQTASSTSEQATSPTLGQTTSFVTYTTTATATTTDSVTNPDTITPLPPPPPPPTQTELSTTTSSLTFTLTETSTQTQEPSREPASQAPNSPTPTETVVQNADSSIGSNAIWAIVGSILGAAASVATIYMCLKQ